MSAPSVPDTPRPSEPILRRLAADLRALLARRLKDGLDAVFEAADGELFQLAEHENDPSARSAFLDAMQECRKRRPEVETALLSALDDGLASAFERRPGSAGGAATVSLDALSLVDDDELEDSLAAQSMANKAEARLAQALFPLNQRLALACARPDLDSAGNPIGPAALAHAFARSLRLLDLPGPTRLVLFGLFDSEVLGGLDELYADANRLLVDAGLLPDLRPRVRHAARARSAAPADGAPSAPPDGHPASAHAAGDTPSHGVPGDLDALLPDQALIELLGARLAQRRAQAGAPAAAAARTPGDAMRTPELQALLLQLARTLPGPAADAPLLDRLHSATPAGVGGIGLQDADTLELVGRLFDFVHRDDTVPPPLAPLMDQLRVPVMCTALSDRRVLSDPDHPVRQLLDEIGAAAIGWSQGADPGKRLLGSIADAIDAVVRQPDAGTPAFERALGELRGFLEVQRHRAELAEQRTMEAAVGRERLVLARRRVSDALQERLDDLHVPVWVARLLTRPWANHLVLLWLRQGEQSEAYTEGLAFADDLIWAASVRTDAERARLEALLPELETAMRAGLARVAYHDSEIEQLVTELYAFARSRLEPEAQRAAAFEDTATDLAVELPPGSTDMLEDQPQPGQCDPALLAHLRELPAGTWFEFRGQGTQERAKLSWVSPVTGRCLFVNRNGLKVSEKHLATLAGELEQGLARILAGSRLVQRALAGILAELAPDDAREAQAG